MKAIQFEGAEGEPVYVQIDEYLTIYRAPTPEEYAGAGAEEIVRKLDQVSDTIAQVCRDIYGRVMQGVGEKRPEEFEIEFGVTLAGEAGIPLVSKGTAEAALKVKAKWVAGPALAEG